MVLSAVKETELVSSNLIAISQLSKGEIQLPSIRKLENVECSITRKLILHHTGYQKYKLNYQYSLTASRGISCKD